MANQLKTLIKKEDCSPTTVLSLGSNTISPAKPAHYPCPVTNKWAYDDAKAEDLTITIEENTSIPSLPDMGRPTSAVWRLSADTQAP